MSHRQVTWILIAILLILFSGLRIGIYMTFQAGHPNFTEKLNLVVVYAERGEWDKAVQTTEDVERIWNRGHALINLKNPDQNSTVLQISLQELATAVKDRNLYETKKAGKSSALLFDSLISILPHV